MSKKVAAKGTKTSKASLLSAGQIKKIKTLSAKGLSERAVAAQVGVSRSSVNKHKDR